jgi:hypothetical protein
MKIKIRNDGVTAKLFLDIVPLTVTARITACDKFVQPGHKNHIIATPIM